MSECDAKAELRLAMRAARRSMSAEDRSSQAADIVARVLALPEVARATRVLGYAAAPEEFDPAPLLEALASRGAAICLPRICGPEALSAHVCRPAEALEPGPFGILQPRSDAPEAGLATLELVIVPGIAFDARGARLGFGGGYYDRLLASVPSAVRLALAFDCQLAEKVPEGEHDERVDFVVTPTRLIRGQRAR